MLIMHDYDSCIQCHRVHGITFSPDDYPQATAFPSALKTAYCSNNPNGATDIDDVATKLLSTVKPDATGWGKDLYPNDSNTSLYFTPTAPISPGVPLKTTTGSGFADGDNTYYE